MYLLTSLNLRSTKRSICAKNSTPVKVKCLFAMLNSSRLTKKNELQHFLNVKFVLLYVG
jgi:hypothetical protein